MMIMVIVGTTTVQAGCLNAKGFGLRAFLSLEHNWNKPKVGDKPPKSYAHMEVVYTVSPEEDHALSLRNKKKPLVFAKPNHAVSDNALKGTPRTEMSAFRKTMQQYPWLHLFPYGDKEGQGSGTD